ncbi:TIGR02117 family protein [Catenovulum maritimum]|uniref:Membrane protein n=1 Tax=Catenovulum maritimum TaxID=1513271 RepID=A0A0J8GVD2_9ALTE|nr:TIGR02117 family protein [Catenovulum maritimum]KMT66745.1 membrane protein [Catenovulum maritimum]
MMYLKVLFLIVCISACSHRPNVIEYTADYSGTGEHSVYVVSHGWHTGIVVPSKHVFAGIPSLKERFRHSTYIEFGWGDKGFYQAKEITTGLTLQAIFIPTESVVHAVGIKDDVFVYFSNSEIEKLLLTDKELESLIQFISGSLAKENNALIPTKAGIYGDSQFYKAIGDYHLLNTCNKWTAKGLQSFGMDISPTFKLTSDSVMDSLKLKNKP